MPSSAWKKKINNVWSQRLECVILLIFKTNTGKFIFNWKCREYPMQHKCPAGRTGHFPRRVWFLFFHKNFVMESRENYQEIHEGTCTWSITYCSVTTRESDQDLLSQLPFAKASLKHPGELITGSIASTRERYPFKKLWSCRKLVSVDKSRAVEL